MFSLTNNCDSTKTDQLQTIRTIYHIYSNSYTTQIPNHTHSLAISIVPQEDRCKMIPDTCSLPKYYLCNIESLIFDNFNNPKQSKTKKILQKLKQKQIIKCNFYITIRNRLRAFLVSGNNAGLQNVEIG